MKKPEGPEQNVIPCKVASRLICESLDHKLSLKQNLALKAHLAICKTCVYCLNQVTALRKIYCHYSKAVAKFPCPSRLSLSRNAIDRIKTFLHKSTS